MTTEMSNDKLKLATINETFYSILVQIIYTHPRKQMAVSEIYKKVMEKYSNFLTKNWKNSVRHALSFKKIFVKSFKKNEQKRGCLWSLDEILLKNFQIGACRNKRIRNLNETVESLLKKNQDKKKHDNCLKSFYTDYFA